VAVARLPLSTDRLRVTVLYEQPRVLLIPVTHRLAGKESVTLDDFADEPLVRYSDPALDAFWRVDPRPDGRPAQMARQPQPSRTNSTSSPPGTP